MIECKTIGEPGNAGRPAGASIGNGGAIAHGTGRLGVEGIVAEVGRMQSTHGGEDIQLHRRGDAHMLWFSASAGSGLAG